MFFFITLWSPGFKRRKKSKYSFFKVTHSIKMNVYTKDRETKSWQKPKNLFIWLIQDKKLNYLRQIVKTCLTLSIAFIIYIDLNSRKKTRDGRWTDDVSRDIVLIFELLFISLSVCVYAFAYSLKMKEKRGRWSPVKEKFFFYFIVFLTWRISSSRCWCNDRLFGTEWLTRKRK